MKRIIFLILTLFLVLGLNAQIFAPEGLNMPGSWDNPQWSNPPVNDVFAGIQGNGTLLPTTNLGVNHYQTIFATPTNIAAGSYQFLFTSGPTTGYWANKWCNVTVVLDSVQSYTYLTTGGNNNSITIANNKVYVLNWEDIGYVNTRAIFMELSSQPQNIVSVARDITSPSVNEAVTVTAKTSTQPCIEQKIYLRYTNNNWASSNTVAFNFTDTVGTAIIPGQAEGKTIQYYVFSTTLSDLTGFSGADIDMVTINLNNNNGANYSYTIPEEFSCSGAIGVIVPEPIFPLQDGPVIITFDATLGNGGLMGYAGDVYAHIGVITSESVNENDWRYVMTDWGENTPATKFTKIGDDLYQLTMDTIRSYFGVPANEDIYQIVMVIRSGEPIDPEDPMNFYVARNADGSDMRLDVYEYGLATKILSPSKKEPLVPLNTIIPVCAYSMAATTFSLHIDDSTVTSTSQDTIIYALNTASYSPGLHMIVADASDGTNHEYDTTYFYIRGQVVIEDLPAGVDDGINYINNTSATLVLADPSLDKEFVFVIGDFNDWTVSDEGYMKRTTDGKHYWITISGLTAGVEYAFQYYIDGELKLADPYAEKILDPWNDQYITDYNYPDLIDYPYDYTKGIVSVLETGQQPYNWVVPNFVPSAINGTQSNLVVYELLIRDFVSTSAIKDCEAKLDYLQSLGVNAIELLPFNEFEGNISWGYNPDFYFATDKYYGTEEDYKHFIDECHQRGIAVIMDMVLNHSFGLCPFVQMYWDSENERPAANSAWYNQSATHPYSPGYDFNHQSTHTKDLVKRIVKYWMTEYKVDGFRFDLSKGFTQTYSGNDVGAWGHYDQSRIDIWFEYYDYIKSQNPNAYVILEHLSDNDEEVALANHGLLLWGNMNTQFNQVTMGWTDNTDFTWALYSNRGYTYPNVIPYMESHDEERLMYRNLTFGNGNITQLDNALQRCAAIYPFYAAIPGPKMIWQFGELGYDYSINYCPDGTISEDCRTSPKPVKWDYYTNENRQFVYQVYQNMNYLKTTQDAFRLGTFTWDVNSGYGKREWISNGNLNVAISGNFGVTGFDMATGFQHTGTWYDLFSQTSINVTDVNQTEYFDPGEFHVFTDVYFPLQDLPNVKINQTSTDDFKVFPNPADLYLTIQSENNGVIYIYDIAGKMVKTQNLDATLQTIDVSDLQKGIYTLVLKSNEKTEFEKIIIK